MEKVDLSSAIQNEVKHAICQICRKLNPPYNCPKCHIAYCSLSCYRSDKHIDCSESFYQDQVMQHLNGQKCSNEERQRLIEILKDEADEQENYGSYDDLSQRLEDIDLNDTEQVWKCLTEAERQSFERSLQADKIDYIEVWKPWWEDDHKRLVHDIEEEEDEHVSNKPTSPDLSYVNTVPTLSALLKDKSLAPAVLFRLFDILLSYVFAARLYNGDFKEQNAEFCKTLFSISSCLLSKDQPLTLKFCIHGFIDNVYKNQELSNCIDVVETSVKDLGMVLDKCKCCPNKVLHCLADISSVFNRILEDDNRKGKVKKLRKNCFIALKNVDFLIAVVLHQSNEIQSWKSKIINLREQMLKERKEIQEEGKTIREKFIPSNQKCLIKELS